MRRRLIRAGAVALLAGLFLFVLAGPAAAHADLTGSDPRDGSTVATSPTSITLSFSEDVEIPLGSVRLVTCAGQSIGIGTPQHGTSSREVVVDNLPALAPGTYLVPWRVISADSHPVQGAISFSVGTAGTSVSQCTATAAGAATKANHVVGVLGGVMRFLVYAGLALLIGGTVFLLVIARGTSGTPRIWALIWTGFAICLVGTIAGVMIQGPYAAGTGLGDAFSWSVIGDVLRTRFGDVAEARVLILAVAMVLLGVIRPDEERGTSPAWWIPAGVVAIALATTPGLAGHAGTGEHVVFAVPLDAVHMLAMSVWVGGLAALLVAALGGGFSGGVRRGITSFARIAMWCVVALVVSGVFATWREVDFSFSNLTDTTFGRILLVKLAFVVALIAVAASSRTVVRRRQAAPLDAPDSVVAAIDDRTMSGLRRSVGGEVLLAAIVLAVTAMLVNTPPAKTAAALRPKVFSTSIPAGSGADALVVNVTVDPARVGGNAVHVYTLTPQGQSLTIRRITGTFVRDAEQIPANLTRGGANHFLSESVVIPSRGDWELVIHVLRGRFNDTPVTTTVRFR